MALLSEQAATRDINYLSRDFDSIKQDLIDYVKRHFPNDWSDFNEASGGMAILEMIAYIGDLISFYTDRQVNEGFINRAVEEKNIISIAENLGYKTRVETPAIVNLTVSAVLESAISSSEMFTILKGSRVAADFDRRITFEILNDVDFSLTSNRTAVDDGTNVTLSISSISAIAGSGKTFTYEASSTEKQFLKITLPDADITEITSVSSNDGYEWTEVDYLAQESVFVGDKNTTSTSGDTPFVLKMRKVPRRFVVEREVGRRTSLRFGSGILSQSDSEFVPNPEDFVLPPTLRGSPSGFSPALIDSSSFLNTRTLGVAPRDVQLVIKYRSGGGIDTNVGINNLRSFDELNVTFNNPDIMNRSLSGDKVDTVLRSITTNNDTPAGGGVDAETFTEIRQNAAANFAAQGRAVTLQDYQVRVMTMPSSFGSVFRSYARKDKTNSLGVELILLSLDNNGRLVVSDPTLKNNTEIYLKRFKSFSDTIRLTDGKIINLGINFSIVPAPNINANEALLQAIVLLRKEFNVKNTNFNDRLVISDYMRKIQDLEQVLAVTDFKFFNRTGTVDGRVYSNTPFDTNSNKINGALRIPEDSCWEVKFLNHDVLGRIA